MLDVEVGEGGNCVVSDSSWLIMHNVISIAEIKKFNGKIAFENPKLTNKKQEFATLPYN